MGMGKKVRVGVKTWPGYIYSILFFSLDDSVGTHHIHHDVKGLPKVGIQHLAVSGGGGDQPFCIIYKKSRLTPLAVVIKLLILLRVTEVKCLTFISKN